MRCFRRRFFLTALAISIITSTAFAQTDAPNEPIFSLKELDKTPVLTKKVDPVYPTAFDKDKIKGKAIVVFIVSKEGRVVKIEAVNASHEAFAAAAREAVSKWEFKPGRKGGKTVACRVVQPMEFNP